MPTQANRGLEWTSRRPKPGSIVKHCTLEYTGTRRYPMVPLRMVGAYMRRVWLGLFVCVLVAALVLFDRIMGSTPIVAERATDLNNLQQKQVDIFLQVTSLLAGFATLSLRDR